VIEALEDDRAGRYCSGRGEAEGADRARELGGGIRDETGDRVKLALELEQERAVDLASEVAR
jgi:hypothetical protein